MKDSRQRRVVLVKHLPPFLVNLVHLLSVPQGVFNRLLPILHLLEPELVLLLVRQVKVHVLGQAMRHIHPETRHAPVRPEPQSLEEVVLDFAVFPVKVWLRRVEQVQEPLAVTDGFPRPAAKETLPIIRRFRAVGTFAVSENVAIAGVGSLGGLQGFLEPDVVVGRVVGDNVDNGADALGFESGLHLVKILEGTDLGVDIAIVGDIV